MPSEQKKKHRDLYEEEAQDPCREPYAQLSFPLRVKVILSGIGWATARFKVNRWLLSLDRGRQSVIIYFFVDKLSEFQISLVGELNAAISSIFDAMCGEFTFSWNL